MGPLPPLSLFFITNTPPRMLERLAELSMRNRLIGARLRNRKYEERVRPALAVFNS